nr:TPA_asm: hypothetical protein HUJ06_001357 [Nelumbo nucifera]
MEANEQQESSKGGWRSSIYIIGVEAAERFAYYGMSANLITYLTDVLLEPTATAAMNVNIWSGVATVLPLLGAFMADSYLGRFKTIIISSAIYLMGLVMLVLSVSVIPLRFQKVVFFFSLYMVAVGEGGHKPCIQTFGADQFDEDKPDEKTAKSSFFNWWYFGICTGNSTALCLVVYIQDNVSWAIGFGVPAIAMAIALALFLFGWRSYRRQSLTGSPLTRVVQVFVAAARKRHLSFSDDGHGDCSGEESITLAIDSHSTGRQTLPRIHQFKFLDKATIIDDLDLSSKNRNGWRLCTLTQVEEVKLLLRLLPIWFSCLIYGIMFSQGGTFFTKQGSTMYKRISSNFSVPPASLQVAIGVVTIIGMPIYDLVFVPTARNCTGFPSGITILQRIGVGIFLSAVAMVIAALVEGRRLKIAREYGLIEKPKETIPMSIFWLLPQYMMMGASNLFAIVGLQELFYDQMPEGMRSMGSAAYLSVLGAGSLLSSALISMVQFASSRWGDEWLGENLNLAHLDYYCWLLAGLSGFGLGCFILVAKCFIYKKTQC